MTTPTPQGNLSSTQLNAYLKIPKSSNSFQVFWEVLDENGNAVSDNTISLSFFVELPAGTRIPFQESPFFSNLNKTQKSDFPLPFQVYVEADAIPANRFIDLYVGGYE